MARKDVFRQNLAERDLNFLVNAAAPEASNKEGIRQYARDDPALREILMADEKVFDSVRNRTPLNLSISPQLYFEVLLRGAIREMKKTTHTVERSVSQKIPVFDLKETLEFLQKEYVIGYLTHLLSSFVAIERGTAKDIDIDVLFSLGKNAKGQTRFLIYKRIADVCLFVLGIFPDYVMYDYYYLFSKKPLPITAEPKRSMSEYEGWGQEFYSLASKEEVAKIANIDELLQTFSDNFDLAKKPLNFLSEHYLTLTQHKNPESL